MAKHRAQTLERREMINEAALKLFAQRGYEGATLDALAAELGSTKQAIYYYYESKEDLVLSMLEESLDRSEQRISAICNAEGDARSRLEQLLGFYFDDYVGGKGFFNVYHHVEAFMGRLMQHEKAGAIAHKMSRLSDHILEMVKQGIAEGQFMALDYRFLGGMILSMITGVLYHLKHPSLAHAQPDELRARAIEIILRGITNGQN